VSFERIDRYKKTPVLRFQDDATELAYRRHQDKRGRSTSIYALSALAILTLVFAFLEHWVLGLNSMVPLFAYSAIAVLCLGGAIFSLISGSTRFLLLRVLLPGALTFITLLGAVYVQEYRFYHAIELALLAVWLGSLNVLSVRLAAVALLFMLVLFAVMVVIGGASEIKVTGLLAVQLSTFFLAVYLSYMMERFRRMLFLTGVELNDVYRRQENWAFTLIDLDLALSGIRDFKEMSSRLIEYIRQVVDYDSFIFTALEGKGPKPTADKVEGTLFEDEDVTLWTDDLMTKLSQTRHAVASAQFEESKGMFGRVKTVFQHFRLDIPIFNDSTLVGVISLRRRSRPYDDLDKTASVSMSAQAMMIYKRTEKSSQMSEELVKKLAAQAPASGEGKKQPAPVNRASADVASVKKVESADTSPAIDITGDSTHTDAEQTPKPSTDEAIIPQAMLQKIRQDTETARKTITLLSRENADQLAKDKYRTAAVEGEPLSILLVEVDGLSSIRENDGDQTAYKVFAGIVKHVFSASNKDKDVLGRYGQNGLSVLLPRVDMNAAEKFAESLREYAESASFKTTYGDRKATLSIGVAAITDDTGNYESMVKRADMALFVAKKNGRNCVKVRL